MKNGKCCFFVFVKNLYFCCIFEKFVKYENFEQNLQNCKYFTNATEFVPEIFAKIFSFTKCNKSAIKYKDELLI